MLILAAFRFLTGASVSAHGSGPPYVKINGHYAVSNPILNIAQPVQFAVGADVASASGYVVGQQVVFEVDEQFFPNPYAQAQNPFGLPVTNAPGVPKASFRWDFKDETTMVEGSKAVHTFNKAGTYIVDLAAKFEGKTQEYTTVNTIQLDVLPNGSYSKPVARIEVNGREIQNSERDTADIKPVTPVSFDASKSTGEISSYQWDFGDAKGANEKSTTHRYSRDEYFPVAVLRVTDKENISVDAYALLNMPFEKPNVFLKVWYAISDFFTGILYRDK